MMLRNLLGESAAGVRGDVLKVEQVRLLYAGLPAAIVINMLLALFLVGILRAVTASSVLLGWLAMIGAVLLIRVALMVAWHRSGSDPENCAPCWLRRFRIGVVATGIAWGVGAAWLFPVGDVDHQVYLAFILAGLSAGAISSLAVDRVSTLGFLATALLPLVASFWLEGGTISMPMSAMVALFLAFIVMNAARGRRSLHENIGLRIKAEEQEQMLRQSKERLEAAASAGIIGIWDWDVVNNQLVWDSVMYQLYGIREEDFGGAYEAWSATVHPDDKAYTEQEIQAALRGEREYAPEFRVIWPDGSIHHLKAVSRTRFDEQGKPLHMVGVNYDLTEQKHIQFELDNLAFHDRLTNLPNRRLLDDRLDQSIARAQRDRRKMALLFIDLDKFKQVNDIHGHDAGDWLLKQVADRIQKFLRTSDTAGRIGGDEFIVLLPDASAVTDAVNVAERIRASLEQPFVMESGQALDISSSIGVAIYPDHADNAQELMRFGDEAMYKAKKSGRNTVMVFEPQELSESAFQLDGESIIQLHWKPSFSCGEPTIDQEHQELFSRANALLDLNVNRNTTLEQFNQAFDALLIHVAQHFTDEEAILRARHYEGLCEHAELHKMLLKRAGELRQESVTSGLPIGRLVEFLVTEVVANHMLKEDKKFFGLFAHANGKDD